jgi:hypothetical protein
VAPAWQEELAQRDARIDDMSASAAEAAAARAELAAQSAEVSRLQVRRSDAGRVGRRRWARVVAGALGADGGMPCKPWYNGAAPRRA